MLLGLFKKKEIQTDEELENMKMIPVPDIRSYMLKGYEEIKEIKDKKEELEEKIADSTPNSVIREKIKELDKQYDEILSKYTKEEYDDWLKMDRISEKLSVLRKILKEGEK